MHAAIKAKEGRLFGLQAPLEDGTVAKRSAKILEDVDGTYKQIIGLFVDALAKALKRAAQSSNNLSEPPESDSTNVPTTVTDAIAPPSVEVATQPHTSKLCARDVAEEDILRYLD
ncbi:hypothetical protein H1R20_g7682, partial [Candolleomyces eurysporus]